MADAHVFRTWDDYFIPGTSVLRNKFTAPGKPFGETDPAKLRMLEEHHAGLRLQDLTTNPIQGRFDYEHMKAIHGYIFQDVYEWAGQSRVAPLGPMTKAGPDVVNYALGDPKAPLRPYAYYPAGPVMEAAAQAEYGKLADKDLLRGLDHESFVRELGEVWGEVNTIHVFREGNARSQFAFFTQLAAQAGWKIDPAHFVPGTVGRDEFVAARFYSQATGSNSRLVDLMRREVKPLPGRGRQSVRRQLGSEIERRRSVLPDRSGDRPPGRGLTPPPGLKR